MSVGDLLLVSHAKRPPEVLWQAKLITQTITKMSLPKAFVINAFVGALIITIIVYVNYWLDRWNSKDSGFINLILTFASGFAAYLIVYFGIYWAFGYSAVTVHPETP